MNNHTSKHTIMTISAALLSATLLLTAPTPSTYAAADTTQANQVQTVAPNVSKQGSPAVLLTSKKVEQSTDTLEINLQVPVISGMKDAAYQNTLNANLAARAKAAVDAITKRAADDKKSNDGSTEFRPYGITIKYELISDGSSTVGDILSFKVYTYTYTGGAHGDTFVETYNVRNGAKASPIKLKELFGLHYKDVINHAVKAEITYRPDAFLDNTFKSISDSQPFYIQGGIAYILFQPYEIAPFAAGIPEIALVIPDTGSASSVPAGVVKLPIVADGRNVKGAKLYKAPNGTLMAPLRPIAEALGYKLNYNSSTRQAEIRRGSDWAKLTLGKDRFAVADMAAFSLGNAPTMKNGTLYVPLSFFTKVLKADLTYTKQSVMLKSAANKSLLE